MPPVSQASDTAPLHAAMTAEDPGAAWDAFVFANPAATFFHRSGWQRVLEQVFGHRTHYLFAVDDQRSVSWRAAMASASLTA